MPAARLFLPALSFLAAAHGLVARRLDAQTIAVSANPAVMTVSTATAGFEPDPVSDASTTYAVTTTAANQKIVARLDAPLPAGVTLTIQLAAPSGVVSRGQVPLTTLDQEVVGAIPSAGTYMGLAVVYRLAATVRAGPVPTTARTVTITVVAGP